MMAVHTGSVLSKSKLTLGVGSDGRDSTITFRYDHFTKEPLDFTELTRGPPWWDSESKESL